MKKQSITFQLLLLSTLLSCCPVLAVDQLWKIDTDHSSVRFEIKNMIVKTVKGEFTNFSGTVTYDGHNLQDAVVKAEIATTSIGTGLPKRDTHLKTNDFLDVIHYPAISFKSRKIIANKSGPFQIIGPLTMHGITKLVTLNAQPIKEEIDQSGKPKLTTHATTTLNRKDFGISMGWVDQSGAAVADKVKVILNIELIQSG